MLRLFLQPQKKERQATPKKTRDVKVEDDEYAGSTDVDEPGLYELTVTGGKKRIGKSCSKYILLRNNYQVCLWKNLGKSMLLVSRDTVVCCDAVR